MSVSGFYFARHLQMECHRLRRDVSSAFRAKVRFFYLYHRFCHDFPCLFPAICTTQSGSKLVREIKQHSVRQGHIILIIRQKPDLISVFNRIQLFHSVLMLLRQLAPPFLSNIVPYPFVSFPLFHCHTTPHPATPHSPQCAQSEKRRYSESI